MMIENTPLIKLFSYSYYFSRSLKNLNITFFPLKKNNFIKITNLSFKKNCLCN